MKTINLRDYYPHYKGNKTVEVPDEIADLLEDYERKEESYRRCLRRFHVFFSLDEGDDIERRALVHGRSPLDILEEQRTTAILYRNIAKLPEKQGRRIYAHFFLGMSQSEIARLEGCHRSTVKESIDSGLMEALGEKDIYHIFKPLMPNTTTRLVLKKPKTESSIRKIWLPKTVAYILRDWRQAQNELKGFLGDEYQDFDLVISLPNGRPCEGRLIEKEFGLLKEAAKLPNVVFHSLRHSSTTYKLKLNHGDLKATQGDTGHAEIDMITKVYAHILDEDRKINAQKFETAFYSNPDLRQSKPPQQQSETPSVDINLLIEQLKHSPELANMLASVLSGERATASLN